MASSTPNGTVNGTTIHSKPVLPIISLAPFLSPSSSQSSRLETAKALVSACHTYGFVYISDHGISPSLLSQAFEISKSFFDLPLDQKMLAPHPDGWAVHRGYSHPGLEKVSDELAEQGSGADGNGKRREEQVKEKLRVVQDFKESYEIGHSQNPDQPNVFPPPSILPQFEPFMLSFYETLFHIPTTAILRALSIGLLGPDHEDKLLSYHSGKYNQLRLLHYPPVRIDDLVSDNPNCTTAAKAKYARMPAHTDWSVLTLLFQDEAGGLQVESPSSSSSSSSGSGSFIDVPPIPGTLVLNIGDLLQRWSNDYLRSTSHRVSVPLDTGSDTHIEIKHKNGREEKWLKSRYSIPYFVTTDPDVEIKCLVPDLESEEEGREKRKAKYEPITQRDYAAMRARMQY